MVRRLAGGSPPTPIYDPCPLARKGKQIPFRSRTLASGWASQPGAWGIPTKGRFSACCDRIRLAREPRPPVGRADRAWVIFSFVPRIGFRRTRTQSAAADGTQ